MRQGKHFFWRKGRKQCWWYVVGGRKELYFTLCWNPLNHQNRSDKCKFNNEMLYWSLKDIYQRPRKIDLFINKKRRKKILDFLLRTNTCWFHLAQTIYDFFMIRNKQAKSLVLVQCFYTYFSLISASLFNRNNWKCMLWKPQNSFIHFKKIY
jgi:hypothetical protein